MRTNNLSKRRVKRIVSCFASGLTAIDTSYKLKLHRNTVNKYYRQIREAIAEHETNEVKSLPIDKKSQLYPLLWHKNEGLCLTTEENSSVEDLLVFGVTVHDGKVYVLNSHDNAQTEIMPPKQLRPDAANLNSSVNATDSPALINADAILNNLPPLISRFFHYSKEKLIKFYGVKPQYTFLYLQELEFRFNNHDTNISNIIIKLLSEQEKAGGGKKQDSENREDATLSDIDDI
ncbi:hypothetical protein C7N43_09705 [Sphingobacteriales bacterium UPWRP_1]|nr:hypothetical protein B6N25_11810 [Sphingobacteriales bacterium TSM_CSS]PSJ77208.1 hypothetical protein C7N43_09705 [Sphingobacteriales bacterium UPWRP_1]